MARWTSNSGHRCPRAAVASRGSSSTPVTAHTSQHVGPSSLLPRRAHLPQQAAIALWALVLLFGRHAAGDPGDSLREHLLGCPGAVPVVTPYHTFCTWNWGRDGPNNALADYQGGGGQPYLGYSLGLYQLCNWDSDTPGDNTFFCQRWSQYDDSLDPLGPSRASCQCILTSPNGRYCQSWNCIKIDDSQFAEGPVGALGNATDDGPADVPPDAIFKYQNYTCLQASRNGLFCTQWAGNSIGGFPGSALAYKSESGSRVPFYRLYTCTASGSAGALFAGGTALDDDHSNHTFCYSWTLRLESSVEYGTGPCTCDALSANGLWCHSWTCQEWKAPLVPHYWVYLMYALFFAVYALGGLCYLVFEYLFLAPPSRLRAYSSKPTTWVLEGMALLAGVLTWANPIVCYVSMRGATSGAQNGYYSLLWALVVAPWCLLLSFLLHIGLRTASSEPRNFDDDRIRIRHLLVNMLAVCAGNLVAMVCSVGNLGAVIGAAYFGFVLLVFAALLPLSAARVSNTAAATAEPGVSMALIQSRKMG